MGNKGWFKPGQFTKEERIILAKKAGEAAAASHRRRKLLRDIVQSIFTDDIKQINIIELIREKGFTEELTAEEILTLKLFQRALSKHKNTIYAFKVIRFLAGQSDKRMKINKRVMWF